MTTWDRFLQKVDITDAAACWRWTASVDKDGYAKFYSEGRHVRGHRYAYEEFFGKMAEGLVADHLCRNPRCVNPFHLEAVTNAENIRRGDNKERRKQTCPRGHRYDTITSEGKRRCSTCHAATQRRYLERQAA